MAEFKIYKGRHELIMFYSPEDEYLVINYNWRLADGFYAVASPKINGRSKYLRFHRLVMNITDPKIYVDHINGDTLDNRRENLRVVNPAENAKNQKPSDRNKTGYKGVGIDNDRNLYRAQLTCNGKTHIKVGFKTAIEAAKIYDMMAIHFFKEYACLNFPNEIPTQTYLEWVEIRTNKYNEKVNQWSKNNDLYTTIIDAILLDSGSANSLLIGTYLKTHNLSMELKDRLMVYLNKQVLVGRFKVDKILAWKNQYINSYTKIPTG